MKKLVKIISWLFAAGSIVLFAGVFYIYGVLVPALPSIEYLEDTQLQVPLRVYDRNDVLLAEFGEHRRIPVDFENIPTHVINAFIAAEDDQFWNHVGVDPIALIAAAYELASTGKKTRGGSTITMQVARNFFLSTEKTYARKLNEILLALRIESELSKEKILELYLNKIFLGHRSYGISAASQVYYGKPLNDLSIAQAAMIAGLPKAPSKYNPIINPERALIRRDHILGRMRVLNFIGDEVYELSRAEPVTAELYATKTIADANYVAELIRADLFEQYGEEVYKAGMNVYTSIDGELQVVANRALRRALLDYYRRHGYRGVITSLDVPDLPESPIDYEIAEDMETLSWDPFGIDLVSDQRVGGLRKGVVISINQNLEPEEPVSADDPVLVEEPSTEAVEEVEIEDKSSATVMISNYQNIDLLFKGGIDWARTYIEVNKQGKAPLAIENVLSVGDVIWLEQRDDQWMLADIPRVEGAIVSIDATDGAIRAMVGGFDYFKNKFNRATQARRQPGSNFKPFIYSAALEKNFTAASIINDAPVVFEDDSLETTWRPENYSGRFYGPTRLREALVKSRNLVSIRILQAIGLRHATRYAERFGFKRANMPYDLSMALGSGTFSPLEIVRAYSVFANGGYLVDPYTTIRVETGDGKVIFQHEALSVCQGCELESLESLELELVEDTSAATNETISSDGVVEVSALEEEEIEIEIEAAPEYAPRVISAQNAFIMRSMMREVVNRGTAVRAKALGRADIGGKTGTTNDQIDAWFSGFNDQVVTTAWVGFDNQQTLGGRETGGRAALPMWLNYMKVALDGIPENLQEQPAGLVTVRIDSQTGKRAGQQTVNSRFEIFRIENAPAEKNVTQSRDDSIAQTGTRSVESDEEIAEEIF
ncbi:MAG: penicillin-binding protein 1A [Gammaproteobacteria bacterium]|nr:penicillin-binding protein 1A [Gammaproteobacteria bacterium]